MTGVNASYIDTSALAKYYVLETASEELTEYLTGLDKIFISSLTLPEMRCMLSKRKRMKMLEDEVEIIIYNTFLNHIEQGYFTVLEIGSRHFSEAANLISILPGCPLRALDALHLAAITDFGISEFSTADKIMADAGSSLGLKLVKFGMD